MPKYMIDLREELGERAKIQAAKCHLSLAAWVRMQIGQQLDALKHVKPYDDPSRGGHV